MSYYSTNQAKKGKVSSHNRNDSSSTLSGDESFPQKTQKESKYKTQICKKWEQGKCEFKEKCIFAHGKHELRQGAPPKEKHASNKTKKCIPFFEKGFCVYGSKCLFSHEEDEQTKLKQKEKEKEKEKNKQKEKGNNEGKMQDSIEIKQPNTSRIPLFIDLERRNIY